MHPVKLFTLSTCSHCRATKAFLDRSKVAYDFTDVDLLDLSEQRKTLREMKRHNPKLVFPTILIGDKVIVGFREEALREALGL